MPDPGEANVANTTSALIHTGLLSVGLSNLFWKGTELNPEDPEKTLLVALGLFCLALPFQGLYILLARMVREYPEAVMVPVPILKLASLCEVISYACGITGFCLMLVRTSILLGAALLTSAVLVILLARSALMKVEMANQSAY